jgi:hypothetical protein
MMNPWNRVSLLVAAAALVFFYSAGPIAAQSSDNESAAAAAQAPSNAKKGDGGRVGAGIRLSTLGVGGEVAVEVVRKVNIRGGVNFFSYSRGYNNNGIHYAGDLRWLSTEAHLDFFPLGHGFHLSPGLIAYDNNHVNATATAPGGTQFTLNGVRYESDPTNAVNGTAKLSFNKTAPTFMIGFGNLVPRGGKHFSVNIEAGVAYQGSPKIALNLTGSACDTSGLNCQNVATNSTIQTNVIGQQNKISNDLSPFKFYPLVSLSFGYRF